MLEIFLQTLPFFALIAIGYLAAATRFFGPEATTYLTKFVFYFALSAMLLRFSSSLPITEIFDLQFGLAYLSGCVAVYLLFTVVALIRGTGWAIAAIEAQCAVIGNAGFLALPMLVALLGDAAAAPVLFVLAIDLIVFGSLVVILITASREGSVSLGSLRRIGVGLLKNPMVMSMTLGLIWSALELPVPQPADDFLRILGSAATPCALFAIGASLVGQTAERPAIAVWLSFGTLVIQPAAVAFFALWVFDVAPFAAGIMIATAAMPTAGNIYILAQHYGVAPARVSSTILMSTVASVATLSVVLGWVIGSGPT
ncbi:MAG: AEC family transporter [Rhodobacteraceae bacterium]|nr:AEC family transporter [Paracoccaceae bacterium]